MFTAIGESCGLRPRALGVSFFGVPQEASVATTYWGYVTELAEVVSLAERGLVDVHIERFALDDPEPARRNESDRKPPLMPACSVIK